MSTEAQMFYDARPGWSGFPAAPDDGTRREEKAREIPNPGFCAKNPTTTEERNDIAGAVERAIDAEEFQRRRRSDDSPDEMEGRGRADTTERHGLSHIKDQATADEVFGEPAIASESGSDGATNEEE